MATPRHREVVARRNVPCPLVILSGVGAQFFGPAFGPRGHGIEESLRGGCSGLLRFMRSGKEKSHQQMEACGA